MNRFFKSKFLWISLVSALTVVLVGLGLNYGVQPKVKRVIKPTAFENKEQMGAVLLRRFFRDLKTHQLIVLGVNSAQDKNNEIWQGLFKTTGQYDIYWDEAYIYSKVHQKSALLNSLRSAVRGKIYFFSTLSLLELNSRFPITKPSEDPLSAPPPHLKPLARKKVLILIPNDHLNLKDKNKLTFLQSWLGKKKFIGLDRLFLSRDTEDSAYQKNCKEKESLWFLKSKQCASLHASRQYYRKQHPSDQTYMALNKYPKDIYYIIIHDSTK